MQEFEARTEMLDDPVPLTLMSTSPIKVWGTGVTVGSGVPVMYDGSAYNKNDFTTASHAARESSAAAQTRKTPNSKVNNTRRCWDL